mmetsp:Transcript_6673/g.13475  ORF Transcript_6673/g.13475 Transcript_6673/m.13475 type:complete len:425 (+) Transcript_6673:59-1333(+)
MHISWIMASFPRHPQPYQLWCPSKHRDNTGGKNLRSNNESKHHSLRDDEAEFYRIRNTRRMEDILANSLCVIDGSSGGNGSDENATHSSPLVVTRPPCLLLLDMMDSCLVVGQEISLTVILLGVHREIVLSEERGGQLLSGNVLTKLDLAAYTIYATMVIIVYFNLQSSSGPWGDNVKMEMENDDSLPNIANNNKDKTHRRSRKFSTDISHPSQNFQEGHRRKKAIVRLSDGLLLAALLRFISGVLRTLTASFSADTVYALAVSGMAIHLLTCDYKYANGMLGDEEGKYTAQGSSLETHPRPAFLGGTVSLNALFFSTALLVSRIKSNATSFAFVLSVVTLFAFYPASRHRIARRYPNTMCGSPCFFVTALLSISAWQLLSPFERIHFSFLQMIILVVSPCIQWWLQRFKQIITGPWDIAHIAT